MSEVYDRTGKFMIAKGNRIIPMRMGGYACDSRRHALSKICIGIECITVPLRTGVPGGGGDPGESVRTMTLREVTEETGSRKTRPAHSRVINFLSSNLDGETVWHPEVGQEYIMRNFIRTISESDPVEQPPRPGELNAEYLFPWYAEVDPYKLAADALRKNNVRKSFVSGYMQATELNMIEEVEDLDNEVDLDLKQLAWDMDRIKIHQDIIDLYCGNYTGIQARADDWQNLERNDPIRALMEGMALAEEIRHHMMTQPFEPEHEKLIDNARKYYLVGQS